MSAATAVAASPAKEDGDEARAALYANTLYTKLSLDDVKSIWSHYPSDLSSSKTTANVRTKAPPGGKIKALKRTARSDGAAVDLSGVSATADDDEYASLGAPISLTPLSGGLSNSNYKIVTSAPANGTRSLVLLKVCDEKTAHELEALIAVSLVLKENGFDTCYPIRKSDGSFIVLYPPPKPAGSAATAGAAPAAEPHRVILFEFLRGRNPLRPTQTIMNGVGRTVAALHSVPLNNYEHITKALPAFPMGFSQMVPFLASAEVSDPKGKWYDHAVIKLFRSQCDDAKELPRLLALPVPQAILHGDVFLENMMFDGDSMIALIDFEETCIGHSVLDVAMTVVGCCYDSKTNELDLGLTLAFLSAYHSVRPFTSVELDTFIEWLRYALLSIVFWRFRQFNVRAPNPARADAWKPILERRAAIDTGSNTYNALKQLLAQPPFAAKSAATAAAKK